MYNITLICTMHREIEKCNSKELYAILEKENPEVIFEEFDISRTDDEYYKNGHYKNQNICSLETTTIMRYLENYQVIHVPVDTYNSPDPPLNMYSKISNASAEYKNLVIMNYILSCKHGFPYLNSPECNNLLEKIHFVEKEVVKYLNDNILSETYKSWQLTADNRDNEMLKNIYNYSGENIYNNAVFIIGADHKISILNKIQESKENGSKINWNLDIFK